MGSVQLACHQNCTAIANEQKGENSRSDNMNKREDSQLGNMTSESKKCNLAGCATDDASIPGRSLTNTLKHNWVGAYV